MYVNGFSDHVPVCAGAGAMFKDNPRPLQSVYDRRLIRKSREAIWRSRQLLLKTRLSTKREAGIQARIEELKRIPGARQEISFQVHD